MNTGADSVFRAFVGAMLDSESSAALAEHCPDAPEFRKVKLENLHVTIRFIGDIPWSSRRRWQGQARQWNETCPIQCHSLTLTGFPTPGRCRVLAFTVASGGKLELLRSDHADFRPHVTIARVRRGTSRIVPKAAKLPFVLQRIALYKSAGGRYTEVVD